MAPKKVGFTISVVAEKYGVHPQTLRTYEREGLLKPSRSDGNTRLFNESDLERLELILSLTRDLGVNLAGVEVVLNMREKMENMQNEVQAMIEYLGRRFGIDSEQFYERMKTALVPVPPTRIVRARKK